jgi:hypothetical protein
VPVFVPLASHPATEFVSDVFDIAIQNIEIAGGLSIARATIHKPNAFVEEARERPVAERQPETLKLLVGAVLPQASEATPRTDSRARSSAAGRVHHCSFRQAPVKAKPHRRGHALGD